MTDEQPRRDTTLEKLAKLKPAFRKGGSVTAGNCVGHQRRRGGAGARLAALGRGAGLASARAHRQLARWPGVDPAYMGLGPIPASRKALQRAGLTAATSIWSS